MRSIRTKVILVLIFTVILTGAILGAANAFFSYRAIDETLRQLLIETTIQTEENVSSKIQIIKNAAIQTGCLSELSNPDVDVAAKKALIQKQAEIYGFTRGNLLDLNGNSYFDSNNYSDRDYFKAALKGEAYVSSPLISKVTNKITFIFSAPLWKNGKIGTEVVGVVYLVPDENILNDIVSNIHISENSYCYIIDKNGTTVADEDVELVSTENTIEEAKTDKSLEAFAELDKKLISGETGVGWVKWDKQKWLCGYTPVSNTDGWGLGIMTARDDFLVSYRKSNQHSGSLAIILLVLSVIASIIFGNHIGKPLSKYTAKMLELIQGNLDTNFDKFKTRNDEMVCFLMLLKGLPII